jgi:hypothetical protein
MRTGPQAKGTDFTLVAIWKIDDFSRGEGKEMFFDHS